MKKFLFLLVSMSLVLFLVNPASAVFFTGTPNSDSPSFGPVFGTLVDFDDYATGTAVGAGDYASVGVASITETTGAGSAFAYYSGSQSQPNYIGTGAGYEIGGATLGWDGRILFEFTNLASMVGIGVANSSGGPEFITAYAADMSVLETYQVSSGANVYNGIDTGAFNIKYFSVTGDFFAVDDLQFDGASVPEPATMLLIGTGLLGLAITRRRMK